MKICSKCKTPKPPDQFNRHRKECLDCRGVYMREWSKRPSSRVLLTARAKQYRVALRAETLAAYGDKCVCCGEVEPRFLVLDHKNNDGAADRKAHGFIFGKNGNGLGVALYARLKREGWPSTFQLLCFNCNSGRELNGGVCPHETAIDAIHLVGACG